MNKKMWIILLVFCTALKTMAGTIVWNGAGPDDKWSTAANWAGGQVPAAYDIAQFDATSAKNCTIDDHLLISGILIKVGYTGTIAQLFGKNLYVGFDGFHMEGGTFVVGNGFSKIWGDFSVSGGDISIGEASFAAPEPYADYFAQVCAARNPLSGTLDMNFVREESPQVPIAIEGEDLDNMGVSKKWVNTTYFDGFGRPQQEVAKQYTPNQFDLVQVKEYDALGREPKQYLPYAFDACTGDFKNEAFDPQRYFYTSNPDPLIAKTGDVVSTYAEKVFDGSPLNKVLEQGSPGLPWRVQPNQAGNTTLLHEKTNTAEDRVLLFTYDFATQTASYPTASPYYSEGQLFVNEVLSPQGNATRVRTVEYKDKQGRTVLKRVQNDAAGTDFLETYYIYDDFNNLRFVLPPQATANLPANGQVGYSSSEGDFADQWLFTYQYDRRQRLVEKKVPGAKPVVNVYDALDRPVLTQDGNQKIKGEYSFFKYDIWSRPAYSGIVSAPSATLDHLRNAAMSATSLFESRTSTGFGYTNTALASLTIAEGDVLSLHYYDDYAIAGTAYAYQSVLVPPYSSNTVLSSAQGLPTCQKTRILDADKRWLTNVTFYDKYGHVLQTQKNNHLYAGYRAGLPNPNSLPELADVSTSAYDFAGKVLKDLQTHTPGVASLVSIEKSYAYDHMGRQLTVVQQTNGDDPVLLARHAYNELGQLVEKDLHSEDNGTTFLQSVDYRYNIRGWLTSINNSALGNDALFTGTNNDDNDLFGMNLLYEQADNALGNAAQFNGNISAVKWKTSNPVLPERAYTYSYDVVQRLNDNNYLEKGASAWAAKNIYTERDILYDRNGNITELNRYGATDGVAIDKLKYDYSKGNRLSKVIDQSLDLANGFRSSAPVQDPNNPTNHYGYDDNGNLKRDDNKGLSNIQYNYLNLMERATLADGKVLSYTYDASGNKLTKKLSGSTTQRTHYVDHFIYDENELRLFHTLEGRAIPSTGGAFKYQYDLKDHLGNVRLSFDKGNDDKAEVIQEDHYYPFGYRHNNAPLSSNSPQNDFLYNGKELQNETEWYDYGARMYDAALGRYHSIDPLAEMMVNETPYHYTHNNPVKFTDLFGLIPKYNWETGKYEDGGRNVSWSDVQSYLGETGGVQTSYQPLTKNRLYDLAEERGYGERGSGSFRANLGNAFESLASDAFGLGGLPKRSFYSALRRQKTLGKHKEVIPDAAGYIKDFKSWLIPYAFGSFFQIVEEFDDPAMVEVKGTGIKSIPVSYDDYQILGELDALQTTAAGQRNKGLYTLITLADVSVGSSIIKEASARKIAVYQIVALEQMINGKPSGNISFSIPYPVNSPDGKRIMLPGFQHIKSLTNAVPLPAR